MQDVICSDWSHVYVISGFDAFIVILQIWVPVHHVD